MNVSYNNLPSAISALHEKQDELLKLLSELNTKPEPNKWFTIDELIDYLPEKPAKQTIYGMVSSGRIPFAKRSKRLLFLKSQIDQWLKSSSRVSIADLEQNKGV